MQTSWICKQLHPQILAQFQNNFLQCKIAKTLIVFTKAHNIIKRVWENGEIFVLKEQG